MNPYLGLSMFFAESGLFKPFLIIGVGEWIYKADLYYSRSMEWEEVQPTTLIEGE